MKNKTKKKRKRVRDLRVRSVVFVSLWTTSQENSKSKLRVSSAANKSKKLFTQRIYIREKKNKRKKRKRNVRSLTSERERERRERKHKVQGRLPHTVPNKNAGQVFPGNSNIINKKINSKNQQSGDDYTTLSTTTKITTGNP